MRALRWGSSSAISPTAAAQPRRRWRARRCTRWGSSQCAAGLLGRRSLKKTALQRRSSSARLASRTGSATGLAAAALGQRLPRNWRARAWAHRAAAAAAAAACTRRSLAAQAFSSSSSSSDSGSSSSSDSSSRQGQPAPRAHPPARTTPAPHAAARAATASSCAAAPAAGTSPACATAASSAAGRTGWAATARCARRRGRSKMTESLHAVWCTAPVYFIINARAGPGLCDGLAQAACMRAGSCSAARHQGRGCVAFIGAGALRTHSPPAERSMVRWVSHQLLPRPQARRARRQRARTGPAHGEPGGQSHVMPQLISWVV
jgi:hypothetical protein